MVTSIICYPAYSPQVADITEMLYDYLLHTEMGDLGIPSSDRSTVSYLIHPFSIMGFVFLTLLVVCYLV